jgi:hypothetical protein
VRLKELHTVRLVSSPCCLETRDTSIVVSIYRVQEMINVKSIEMVCRECLLRHATSRANPRPTSLTYTWQLRERCCSSPLPSEYCAIYCHTGIPFTNTPSDSAVITRLECLDCASLTSRTPIHTLRLHHNYGRFITANALVCTIHSLQHPSQ